MNKQSVTGLYHTFKLGVNALFSFFVEIEEVLICGIVKYSVRNLTLGGLYL